VAYELPVKYMVIIVLAIIGIALAFVIIAQVYGLSFPLKDQIDKLFTLILGVGK
jgi:hypothetical protein